MKFLRLLACLNLSCAAWAGVVTDIEYGKAAGESLRLDASVPGGAGPFPAVIVVHGGGWMSGDKARNEATLFAPLNRAGIAWFSINYRLAPKFRYPACLDDVDCAIRWVKAHAAAYRVDPRRLALLGDSAGGQLVDAAAVGANAGTRVAAVVFLYAPCDFVADARHYGRLSHSMTALFGLSVLDATSEKVLHDASPLNYVSATLPPFLLFHGTADKTVPYDQSVQWQSKLRSLGVSCDLITVPGGAHGMDGWVKIDPAYPSQVVTWLVGRFGIKAPAGGA